MKADRLPSMAMREDAAKTLGEKTVPGSGPATDPAPKRRSSMFDGIMSTLADKTAAIQELGWSNEVSHGGEKVNTAERGKNAQLEQEKEEKKSELEVQKGQQAVELRKLELEEAKLKQQAVEFERRSAMELKEREERRAEEREEREHRRAAEREDREGRREERQMFLDFMKSMINI